MVLSRQDAPRGRIPMHLLLSRLFRRRRAHPHHVLLYSRPGCHLCDEALELLHRIGRRYPLEVEEVDIRSDPILLRRYDISIPVVVIDGRIELAAPITEAALREIFARRPPVDGGDAG
jgi:glutaredoxin